MFWSQAAQSYFEHYQQLEKHQGKKKQQTTALEKRFMKKTQTNHGEAQNVFPVSKYSETFVKEKAIPSSWFLKPWRELNLLSKTYPT